MIYRLLKPRLSRDLRFRWRMALIALQTLVLASVLDAEEPPKTDCKIVLAAPADFQVFQTSTNARGQLVVAGRVQFEKTPPENIEACVTGKAHDELLPRTWVKIPFDSRVTAFRGELSIPRGGWYRLEVRANRGSTNLALTAVEHVGVGEIFVIAGQSNAANHGERLQKPASGMVSTCVGPRWQIANDPQPGASGGGGSFIPAFGDAMYERFRVPIGIVATAVGATSIREWLPRGISFENPPTLTGRVITVGPNTWESDGSLFEAFTARLKSLHARGFRAVLWHQGESDANQALADRTLSGDRYYAFMKRLIDSSRHEAGWDFPWFVAQASYHTPDDPGSPDIRKAQASLWQDYVALEGPDTDALIDDNRDQAGKGVHFSEHGLQAHGKVWAEKVGNWLASQP
jgi:hypothetical protein